MLPPNLQARVDRAVDNFMQGYGCCQSVVAAFADLYGLDDTMAKRIGAGFGGGVGRMRMMCGAGSKRFPHLCRDPRLEGQRQGPVELRGFCSHSRILQDAPLCRKGRERSTHLCGISFKGKKVKR